MDSLSFFFFCITTGYITRKVSTSLCGVTSTGTLTSTWRKRSTCSRRADMNLQTRSAFYPLVPFLFILQSRYFKKLKLHQDEKKCLLGLKSTIFAKGSNPPCNPFFQRLHSVLDFVMWTRFYHIFKPHIDPGVPFIWTQHSLSQLCVFDEAPHLEKEITAVSLV